VLLNNNRGDMSIENYMGITDAFTLIAFYNTSYLSNYSNKNLFSFGTFPENIQCLWVNRIEESRK